MANLAFLTGTRCKVKGPTAAEGCLAGVGYILSSKSLTALKHWTHHSRRDQSPAKNTRNSSLFLPCRRCARLSPRFSSYCSRSVHCMRRQDDAAKRTQQQHRSLICALWAEARTHVVVCVIRHAASSQSKRLLRHHHAHQKLTAARQVHVDCNRAALRLQRHLSSLIIRDQHCRLRFEAFLKFYFYF